MVCSSNPAWNQLPIGKYNYLNKGYIFLKNDSIVTYILPFGTRGTLKQTQAGIGIYKTFSDTLIIWTGDSIVIQEPEYELTYEWDTNSNNYERSKKIFTFDFITENEVILTGPIIENYEKLNSKKFLRGLLRWPWRWSFKKEHWYDPEAIVLIKE